MCSLGTPKRLSSSWLTEARHTVHGCRLSIDYPGSGVQQVDQLKEGAVTGRRGFIFSLHSIW
jgi:hypothetical protein